ncbi:hypothetical protein [Flagellimonas olearia]|uniref:DUF4377 domain-containing protein n=1 Tax=Flagellimonas olearia TaxID=552546 RepID=A0A444VKZ4_9FLAO|nr:hypothetical protein [Allomuricauda olearia]RYC51402.1 hypothetical protein DN53_14490 [Allomuricauda olearia]
MKKLTLAAIAIFAFVLSSCEVESAGSEDLTSVDAKGKAAKNTNSQIEFDLSEDCQKSEAVLLAGQHTEVGKVTVTESGDNYIITYEITNDEWCISETHLSVVNSPEDFPMTNSGNPKNGNFEYKDSFDCAKTVTYEVPTSKGPYIAAHAVVNCLNESAESIAENLPVDIDFCAVDRGTNTGLSYWSINISNSFLAGDYNAWCLDANKPLGIICAEGSVVSSYSDLSSTSIAYTDNMNQVNWIINQDFVGTLASNGEAFTFGDVQVAIWSFVENAQCPTCGNNVGEWSEERAQEIIDLANINGTDYMPDCGELLGLIILPDDTGKQPLLISYPIECSDCEETAWADGCSFPGNNWATYFSY